ncbi:MAG TPA: DUF5010 domain-containing protein [Candidatus Dormibacteraeota bacterium]|nr:DUF5010 domain-containing protein [Candidatus Dormibacteraeota bacterium]
MTRDPGTGKHPLRRAVGLALGLVLMTAMTLGCTRGSSTQVPSAPTAPPVPADRPVLMTYYYYWYDATTGAHLQPSIMRYRFPPTPPPSWRSVAWQEIQLSDMSAAGIDGALAVYWGHDNPTDAWSYLGLNVMAQAAHQLVKAGRPSPKIGMFFDTTVVDKRDLRTPQGKAWFYSNFNDFFTRIPRDEWLLVDGRPVVFLFTSDFTEAFDQSTFDYVYDQFQADFGVRPYIVREVSWDFPFSGWSGGTRQWDYTTPIKTDNNYLWAASIHGYVDRGGVAAVGPGFDDHLVPGRGAGTIVDRQDGAFYKRAFDAAIHSGKKLLAIETWDEMHEGSNICDTVEFGRQYIDITRAEADIFHAQG